VEALQACRPNCSRLLEFAAEVPSKLSRCLTSPASIGTASLDLINIVDKSVQCLVLVSCTNVAGSACCCLVSCNCG
jgi:hypothetical protein